jgi:osmotically-inducible protein OsmY
LVCCPFAGQALGAEDGAAERIGEKIDRGLSEVSEKLKQGWAAVRTSVEKMGVEARVYSRLHWDKALENAPITIEVRNGKVVTLKGSVPDSAARAKAVALARDTVGVTSVDDQLAIAP